MPEQDIDTGMDWRVRIFGKDIYCIIIIFSSVTVFAGVLFAVHQPGANHEPGASVTLVNHSVHKLSTFLRIRADPSMQILWVSVRLALPYTFLMFSTIPLLLLLLLLLLVLLLLLLLLLLLFRKK